MYGNRRDNYECLTLTKESDGLFSSDMVQIENKKSNTRHKLLKDCLPYTLDHEEIRDYTRFIQIQFPRRSFIKKNVIRERFNNQHNS